jgi:hypothetical protein
VLGQRRGGRSKFRWRQPTRTVLVRRLELVDGLARPFLERQPAIAVGILAKALRLGPSNSSLSIFPSLFLSAREKRFSSRLLALASGATSCAVEVASDALYARADGGGGYAGK